MKKIALLSLSFLLFLFSCEKDMSEQQAQSFIKYFGDYLSDVAQDVVALDDGGYALCGTATIPDTGSRMFLIITDEFGNPEPGFPTYYTVDDLPAGGTTLVSKKGGQGGFLLCGYVEKPKVGSSSTQKDILIVKTSSTGDKHWTRVYGSEEDDVVLHGTHGLSSGYMLTGYKEINSEKDIMVMGLEEDGDSIELEFNFNKPFGSEDAIANYIVTTEDTYLAVCTYDKYGGEGTDILVLNFDDELSPNDEVIQGNYNEYGKCIVHDTLNKYIVLGNRVKDNTGNSEMLVYSIEKSGMTLEAPRLQTSISEINADLASEKLIRTEAGKYVIVGTRTSNNQSDIFVQFLSENYLQKDRIFFGELGDQTGQGIDNTLDGGLIICGSNGDANGNNNMITLIKTDELGKL